MEPAKNPAVSDPAEHPTLMEPMLPREGVRELEDLTADLIAKSSRLAGHLHTAVQGSIGGLVRSMNCYYSNLIEGHDTHPRDIDRALQQNYAAEPRRRALQLEAVAHIRLQQLIDDGADLSVAPTSREYIQWLHQEFCSHLPDELLWVENPATGKRVRVIPGEVRDGDVAVGRHTPPEAAVLSDFLKRFQAAYDPGGLSKLIKIAAVPSAHHRLLWIHPFYDGNGRVVRLMSHAMLERAGVGSGLWSVSRGLAREVNRYKQLLEAADEPRRNDLDGRGSLSETALLEFCTFFLQVCLDQVDFMESLLQPAELIRRIEIWAEDESRAGRIPKGSFRVLREALLRGNLDRGEARTVTGYQERMGRAIVSGLLEKGILKSEGPRSPLRLAFPLEVVERWFPRLYPAT